MGRKKAAGAIRPRGESGGVVIAYSAASISAHIFLYISVLDPSGNQYLRRLLINGASANLLRDLRGGWAGSASNLLSITGRLAATPVVRRRARRSPLATRFPRCTSGERVRGLARSGDASSSSRTMAKSNPIVGGSAP